MTRNRVPLTLNPKPESRNPKPETWNLKPETRNPKPEILIRRRARPSTRRTLAVQTLAVAWHMESTEGNFSP